MTDFTIAERTACRLMHVPHLGAWNWCRHCEGLYPCITIRFLDALEQAEADRDRYRMMYEEESET